MKNIVRTFIGSYLQTLMLLGKPFDAKEHTTLNEALNISPDETFEASQYPSMRYLGFGNGGHEMTTGGNGIPVPTYRRHMANHVQLYNQLPCVLRTFDNDLTLLERAKYRMRRVEQHDGVSYVAYYLKVLDLSGTIAQIERRTVVDGFVQSSGYVPTIGDMSPVPPTPTQAALAASGDYICVTAKVPFLLTPTDVQELLNVSRIIYGDENYAIISEIMLVSGIDKVVSKNLLGYAESYTELVAAQANVLMNTFYAVTFANNGIESLLDVGSVEPMLTLTANDVENSLANYVQTP